MRARRLVFLGPPGTGKGTQAQILARTHALVPMSSGDALRSEMRAGSDIGLQAKKFVEAGTLVPDDVVTGVMLAGIEKLPNGSGFILDGFPRTVPQAEALDAGLNRLRLNLDLVLDFQLADEMIVRRIVGRRICTKCNTPYNVESLPPRVAGLCDNCGTPLVQRVDDREDVIATRLATYRSQTAPLVDFYERRGLLRAVDASASAEAVQQQVARLVSAVIG